MACFIPANAGGQLLLNHAGLHLTLIDRPIALCAVERSIVAVRCKTLDAMLRAHQAPLGLKWLPNNIERHELVALSGFAIKGWKHRPILIEDYVSQSKKHRFV